MFKKLKNIKKTEKDIIAYRCLYNKIYDVQVSDAISGDVLPKKLIIKPGEYEVAGNVYSMNDEGLYRLIQPFDKIEQRIVYTGGGMKRLLSCYLQCRGFLRMVY